MSSAESTNGGCCVIRDRFQIFLCLLLFLHKARTTFSDQAVFPVLALSMDMFALFGMYVMHKTNKRLSGSSLAITIVVNSLKYVSLEEQDILHLAVALGALTLLWLHYQSSFAVIVSCLPAMLAYFGHLPSPFAVAYTFYLNDVHCETNQLSGEIGNRDSNLIFVVVFHWCAQVFVRGCSRVTVAVCNITKSIWQAATDR
jgi:hypothetical protein